MNLTELIAEFKEASGRIDFSDSEITKYLNRGVKYLDEITFRVNQDVRAFSLLDANHNLSFLHRECRTVKEVWAYTATERRELAYISLDEMRELYKTSEVATGVPESYTLSSLSVTGNNELDQQTSIFGNWADFAGDDTAMAVRVAIIVYPAPEETYSIETLGNFYTTQLSNTSVENWWSVRHPEAVVLAAIYRMDNNYRNTQGGKDLLSSILEITTAIYHDDLETQFNRPSKMEG